jgi:hypothetical protein
MSVRAANSARKNATFASLGESLWTGPGGASKNRPVPGRAARPAAGSAQASSADARSPPAAAPAPRPQPRKSQSRPHHTQPAAMQLMPKRQAAAGPTEVIPAARSRHQGAENRSTLHQHSQISGSGNFLPRFLPKQAPPQSDDAVSPGHVRKLDWPTRVGHYSSKLVMRVRFPSPAPTGQWHFPNTYSPAKPRLKPTTGH